MHSSKSSISSIYFNDAPASHFVNSKEYKQERMIAKYASLNKFLFSREFFFFQIGRTNFIPDNKIIKKLLQKREVRSSIDVLVVVYIVLA